MTTAFACLPNAHHISWVLSDLKKRPQVWSATWNAAWDETWGVARDIARSVVKNTGRDATWDIAWIYQERAARDAAWGAVRDAAWEAARNAGWSTAWNTARGTILTFIAYDETSEFVDRSIDDLRALYRLSHHPMFLLLQPYAIVKATP